jgi:curli biogenesis system outer membrane secretion channel CsgG
MKAVLMACILAALAACGMETASTAATSTAIKKQELDQGKKSLERAEQKIGQAVELQQQRATSTGERADTEK